MMDNPNNSVKPDNFTPSSKTHLLRAIQIAQKSSIKHLRKNPNNELILLVYLLDSDYFSVFQNNPDKLFRPLHHDIAPIP